MLQHGGIIWKVSVTDLVPEAGYSHSLPHFLQANSAVVSQNGSQGLPPHPPQ